MRLERHVLITGRRQKGIAEEQPHVSCYTFLQLARRFVCDVDVALSKRLSHVLAEGVLVIVLISSHDFLRRSFVLRSFLWDAMRFSNSFRQRFKALFCWRVDRDQRESVTVDPTK